MKVLITGDSHAGALLKGKQLLVSQEKWPQEIDLNIRPLGGGIVFTTPFFVKKGDYIEFSNPIYRKQFIRFPPEEMENSDVIYGLSGPLHSTRIWRHNDWSKYTPYQLTQNEIPISNSLLRQTVIDDTKYLFQFIDFLLDNKKKLFVIEGPKPFRHHPAFTITRPEIIQYIDNYYRNFVKKELEKRFVSFISIDSDCYDVDGFMLSCYRHENEKDQHHANAEFGALMMKKVLDFVLQ